MEVEIVHNLTDTKEEHSLHVSKIWRCVLIWFAFLVDQQLAQGPSIVQTVFILLCRVILAGWIAGSRTMVVGFALALRGTIKGLFVARTDN